MRKLLFPIITLVLTLSMILLMVIPAMAVGPTITTILDGPTQVGISDEVDNEWTITITICPDDVYNLDEVVVQGGIGADLVIKEVNGFPVSYPMLKKTEQVVGDVTLAKRGGKMGATIVKWDIGTLESDGCLTLVLLVGTGNNPQEKLEFTSAELGHELDGGFSATYTYEGVEYETLETEPLTVDVVE
jgi:hypothetical protein